MRQRLPVERLKPAFAFLLTAFFILSLMSFTYDGTPSSGEKTKSDSAKAQKEKNLKELLFNYNPATSYIFQLNPQAVVFVQDYIQENKYDLEKMRKWGKPYFDIYDKILADNDLPVELKYLSVIESNLSSGLVSSAGAVGPWQLMRDEAKRFGLRTGKKDQRKDFTLSTKVAAKLLHELYYEFGDWLLVIAAYNCGVGRMKQAIRKAGTDDFWQLQNYLPLQTRNHVKKFIATHFLFEGGGGWTTMTAKETDQHKENLAELLPESTAIAANSGGGSGTIITEKEAITGKYNSVIMAKSLAMDIKKFNALNPSFDQQLSSGSSFELNLPAENMQLFKARKNQILKESMQLLMTPAAVQ